MRVRIWQQRWKSKISCLVTMALILQLFLPVSLTVWAKESKEGTEVTVIHAEEYGVDPNGLKDSTQAIQRAFEAAKEAKEAGAAEVVVDFPKGEYHIYKDYAEKREYHTSNTNSIESPEKTIGLLIEDQHDFTLRGNGSLFLMHGNMMALAVVNSSNVTLEDFSWDFAVPTVSEMTIAAMGEENGKPYTDFYIPKCFPYEIQGTTIQWHSEPSPYTGEYYWTEEGIHRAYSVVVYHPDDEMTRAYFTSDTPFNGVSNIRALDGTDGTMVRVTYNSARPQMQKKGMILELASSTYRETAGAFTWESENVTARNVNVHFMHGFGWLVQMSRDVYYYNCNLMPRENSGHITVSYADGIHASGAAGDLVIENCNFSNTHDDPINLHGTFTRVEERKDAHTLKLKYIHTQQGGFPQYHAGDKVAFFTRDTLESTDSETLYTVEEVISNPGESGNDLRTMEIRFTEELPENLSDKIGNEPKYVAENVTFAPSVEIRGCTFKNVPTRGILCTTRNPVVIEDNTFLNMSMATIFLSNDSNEWYESGPIRDMTIRNNTFYVKTIGRTSWEYAPAVYVHPVTKGGGLPSEDNPIHKNILIEGNTFHMDVDTVVKAESVENLTIRNNTIVRTNPDISLEISASNTQLGIGETGSLQTEADGDVNNGATDNVYEFTKCKNVVLEGNTYDDGLKRYAVLSGMQEGNLTNRDSDIAVVSDRGQEASAPVGKICYASTDPGIVYVDHSGRYTAVKEGTAEILAYYEWNDTIVRSNRITVTVLASQASQEDVEISGDDNIILNSVGATHTFTVAGSQSEAVDWSVKDFLTGEETDAAQIDENGTLTANRNGVVWVKASVGEKSDKKAVILAIPKVVGRNPLLTVTRENAPKYQLEKNQVTVDMERGDLYEGTNTVKNLFLYKIPQNADKDNLRMALTIDRLPVKESGQWDTASFILYKDDDNYVTVGKKSHMNGIAVVKETNAHATETGESNEANNQVTKATFGFCKKGSSISVDYKLDGTAEWTHLTDISDMNFGQDFQVGFAGWVTNIREKDLVFSELHIGSGDISYDELCAQKAIPFCQFDNQLPTAENVSLDKTSYQVGENVNVTFDFQDDDGDAQGTSLYRFTCVDENLEIWETISESPSAAVMGVGTLTCTVYPVDEMGCVGEPVCSQTAAVSASENGDAITELTFNGNVLYQLGQTQKEFDVYFPAELTKAVIGYQTIAGEVTINGDSVLSPAVVNIENQEEIRIACGEEIFLIHPHAVEDNYAKLEGISIESLSFEPDLLSEDSWFLNADGSMPEVELEIMSDERLGKVELLGGFGRKEIALTGSGDVLTARLRLVNGINSYYIRAVAKDGITVKQYMVHINHAASTDAKLAGIKVDHVSLEDFNHEGNRMIKTLDEGSVTAQIEVEKGNAADVCILSGDRVIQGTNIEIDDLIPGGNEIRIISKASDGTRLEYTVLLIVPDVSNAELLDLSINGKSVFGAMKDGAVSWVPSEEQLTVEAVAEDSRAIVNLQTNTQRKTQQGSVEKEINLYEGSLDIFVQVTSFDGKETKNYRMICEKEVYLSDLGYEPDSTVGYGSIMRDKASSGKSIRLTGADGNPVVYEKGIGTHANSEITYDISAFDSKVLHGAVGVDYEKHGSEHAALEFSVLAEDGTALFSSGVMNGSTPQKEILLDLTDVDVVTLKVIQQSNNWDAHADWAKMKLSLSFADKPQQSADVSDLAGSLIQANGIDFTICTSQQVQAVLQAVSEAEALWESAKRGEAVSQDEIGAANERLKTELENAGVIVSESINLKDCTITLNPESCIYNGKPQCPEVTVEYEGETVPKAKYRTEYSNNIEPGTATVTITAVGSGYKGTVTKEFEIEAEQVSESVDLKDCTITLNPETCIYNGKPQCPEVTVEYEGEVVPESEYETEYANNTEPGTATVTITAVGSGYKGTVTKEFEIKKEQESVKINLKDCIVTLNPKSLVYNGKPQQPTVTVTYRGKIVPQTEYNVAYQNNTNAGKEAKAVITAKNGNYTGSRIVQFSIGKKSLTASMVKMKSEFTWENGRQITPVISLMDGNKTLKKGTDYIVVYPKESADIGNYTVSITGKGNYTAVVSKGFRVFIPLGTTYTIKRLKYKVTGTSTVMLTGTSNKKISSLKVKNIVTIGGTEFRITAVGNKAFKGCKKLKNVSLGANIEKIGKNAFQNCRKLSNIQLKGKKVKTIGKKAIAGINKKAVIKIPKSKKKAYKRLLKSSVGYKKTMKIKTVK